MLQLSLDLLELASGNIEQNDVWSFIWGNQHYSAQRYYQHHFAARRPTQHVLWIWKSRCMPRIKFFAWLQLNDRLNTWNTLRHRKQFLQEGYSYVLCHGSVEETLEHLFYCTLASACCLGRKCDGPSVGVWWPTTRHRVTQDDVWWASTKIKLDSKHKDSDLYSLVEM